MRVPLCNFFDERSELVALPSKYAALNERILQRRKAGNQRAQLSFASASEFRPVARGRRRPRLRQGVAAPSGRIPSLGRELAANA